MLTPCLTVKESARVTGELPAWVSPWLGLNVSLRVAGDLPVWFTPWLNVKASPRVAGEVLGIPMPSPKESDKVAVSVGVSEKTPPAGLITRPTVTQSAVLPRV